MGPLEGLRVLELAGIGPVPFAAMLLADMGADVLRIDRVGGESGALGREYDVTQRGRARIAVDLKSADGRDLLLELAASADVLIEGFRPGVMERLELGPEAVAAVNERLVYGRMTGYGQTGPMAEHAGHDINYISIAGVLGAIARPGERPLPPLNLLGDYGGGAMFLAFGVLCAVLEARGSGRGQVVDAAMVEGAALLSAIVHGFRAAEQWSDTPGTNLIDTGAPFYDVYATRDGGHVAVGPLEPKFFRRLLELVEIEPGEFEQYDRACWPRMRERFTAIFAAGTTDEWRARLEPDEACATVVLTPSGAPEHPHNRARGTFVTLDGVTQPGPAPRFSRTPGRASPATDDAVGTLHAFGMEPTRVRELQRRGTFCE